MEDKEQYSRGAVYTLYVAALGGCSVGLQSGIISGALPFLTKQYELSYAHQGFIVSVLLIGAMFGVAISGWIADRFGRLKGLFLQAILFCIGTLLVVSAQSLLDIVLGRLITGVAIGIVSSLVPLYLSEISPDYCRGRFVAMYQFFVAIGFLLAYAVNAVFSSSGGWRFMFAIGFLPCVLQLGCLIFSPESPSWLLSKGLKAQAELAFEKLRSDRLWKGSMDASTQPISSPKTAGFLEMLQNPRIRKVVGLGIILNMFQQITGVNMVLYYSPKIFQAVGFSSLHLAILASIAIGMVNLISTGLSLRLIDKMGRRSLLFISLSGMAFFLLIFSFIIGLGSNILHWIGLFCLIGYMGCFAIGLGPVTFVVTAELYPLAIRGRAISLAIGSNWVFNYLLSFSFPLLLASVGIGSVFALFTLFTCIALLFIYFFIPETKGKSLSQIADELK